MLNVQWLGDFKWREEVTHHKATKSTQTFKEGWMNAERCSCLCFALTMAFKAGRGPAEHPRYEVVPD